MYIKEERLLLFLWASLTTTTTHPVLFLVRPLAAKPISRACSAMKSEPPRARRGHQTERNRRKQRKMAPERRDFTELKWETIFLQIGFFRRVFEFEIYDLGLFYELGFQDLCLFFDEIDDDSESFGWLNLFVDFSLVSSVLTDFVTCVKFVWPKIGYGIWNCCECVGLLSFFVWWFTLPILCSCASIWFGFGRDLWLCFWLKWYEIVVLAVNFTSRICEVMVLNDENWCYFSDLILWFNELFLFFAWVVFIEGLGSV